MIQSLNKPKDDVRVESSVQKAKEKKLYTLRVTNTTVILVPLHKRNEEYAKEYRKNKMGLIYISLPISGKDIEEVKLKAREAAVLLEEDGHVPITPFEVSPNPNATYAEHMGKDIQALLECDAAMFLQGWHDSKGCLAEFEIAKIYGKKLIFE